MKGGVMDSRKGASEELEASTLNEHEESVNMTSSTVLEISPWHTIH